MNEPLQDKRIGIVGGGLMGTALAHKFARAGNRVTIFESESQLGGLATWANFGSFTWDEFYHVILPTDRNLIRFVSDIGLADRLEWRRTYTGFYVNERLYSISSNLEFLRFPLLSLFGKARLAWTMVYCSRISDWRRLEAEDVESFLLRISGREAFDKLWKPLLLAKLGESYRRVSAVFIWSYIKRLFSARDASANAEHLGYVRGGYKTIFDKLANDIRDAGGVILTGTRVSDIRPVEGDALEVAAGEASGVFDQVICTSPVPVLRRIVAPDLLQVDEPGSEVEYLGVVCLVVVSRKPLVPFYVVNIADTSLPFTGLIGMSTVVDTSNTAGRCITYLPKYVLAGDAWLERSDIDVQAEFMNGLRRMLPDLDTKGIESLHVHRRHRVQPLQVLGYSRIVPKVRTRHPCLSVINTSQFVSGTLNNNEVIGAVDRFYSDSCTSAARDVA